MRERELGRSWPQALALAAAVSVGTGLLVGLVMWLIGGSWENGAFIGFFVSLVNDDHAPRRGAARSPAGAAPRCSEAAP